LECGGLAPLCYRSNVVEGQSGARPPHSKVCLAQVSESIVCREVNLMKHLLKHFSLIAALLLVVGSAVAQERAAILTGAELTRVVPTSFYFQGLSAPTQMRNSAAARFGKNRYVIVGLVDTSGYSADVRAKYVGFLITDSPITINGESLAPGMTVLSIGSTLPEQREVDASVIAAAGLVVADMVDEVVHDTGDMLAAKRAGITFEHNVIPLSDVVGGRHAGRTSPEQIVLYKSVGAAIQDLAVAAMCLTRATERGVGTLLRAPIAPVEKGK